MQTALAVKERVEPRVRAMVRATLRDSRNERDVCLVDISTRGLLATTANPPRMGEIVEFRIGRNIMIGQVRWASARRFGVALRDRVCVAALVEGGKRDASLTRSVAAKPAANGSLSGFESNPALVNRIGQLVMLGILVAAAALAIMTMMSEGINSVGGAMSSVNARSGN